MSLLRSSVLVAAMALGTAAAGDAQARVVVGFGFGWPFYAPLVVPPPPVYYSPYYAPPAYYPPPATFSYTPPQSQPQSLAPYGGQRYGAAEYCQAGPYTCPLVVQTPPGGGCACPGNDGRRVRGRAY